MSTTDRDIFKDNQYEAEFELTKKHVSDGTSEPAAAQPGLFIWLAATKGGAEIHAEVKAAATERDGKPGTYYCVIPTAAINVRLFGNPSFDGHDVFVIMSDGAAIRVYDRVKAHAVRPSA